MFFEEDEDEFHVPVAGKFANRSQARAVAFQILFQEELNPNSSNNKHWIGTFLDQELSGHSEVTRFAQSLIEGVKSKKAELDRLIANQSRNWSFSRLSVTDRNILRLSLYEIFDLDTPKAVVISEAIELAKRFGSAESASFVNGILDQFQKKQNDHFDPESLPD